MSYRVLATGDRHWADRAEIRRVFAEFPVDVIVMLGSAGRADSLVDDVCLCLGIPVLAQPADWHRTRERARTPTAHQPHRVVVFHVDLARSVWTRRTVKRALAAGIPVTHYRGGGRQPIEVLPAQLTLRFPDGEEPHHERAARNEPRAGRGRGRVRRRRVR